MDGDGDLDLVAGNDGQANPLYVNNGTSDPWNGVTGTDVTPDSNATQDVVLGDVDGDGDPDLVAGNFGQANRLYVNNGTSDPWNGMTGIDVTADADETYSVALEDVDGDGGLDLVAGNRGQPNRYYSLLKYDTARRRATALRVDSEVDLITNATLMPMATLPRNTDVEYWLSNDGGTRWYLIRPGVPFLFPSPGLDLRWRAELSSLSPVLTPLIDQIQIIFQFQPPRVGDRVWEDLDGDGVQDAGEPGLASFKVLLVDGAGFLLDFAVTDASGNYGFDVVWGDDYSLRFFPPPGYTLSPQDQGGDDALDSDVDPATGETPTFTLIGIGGDNHSRWDAGMIPPCVSPDEPIFIYEVTLTTDGNDYPILNFQDPNQPAQISGYNVYRNSDPAPPPPPSTWPLVASDVIDMDEATPNKQWVDTSGDVSPSGVWYYQITAFNSRCSAGSDEGPF